MSHHDSSSSDEDEETAGAGGHQSDKEKPERKEKKNMYLSRKQVRLMRLAHDHILEQLGAGGSPMA